MSKARQDEILHYWFGNIESTVLPTENRQHIWTSREAAVRDEVKTLFLDDVTKARAGKLQDWEPTPKGSLALILLFDQFPRKLYDSDAKAYESDQKALDLCLIGVEKGDDHNVSLIERAFFYSPLMHSESMEMQSISVRAYQMLVDLSFPEAVAMFDGFLQQALKNYEVIKQFRRFPARNVIVGRSSTEQEMSYLKIDNPNE